MPAETHQRTDAGGVDGVLELLAAVVGGEVVEVDDPATVPLESVGVDDDLAVLHLWSSVVEEFGERSLGEVDLEGTRPETLGELAALFYEALTW